MRDSQTSPTISESRDTHDGNRTESFPLPTFQFRRCSILNNGAMWAEIWMILVFYYEDASQKMRSMTVDESHRHSFFTRFLDFFLNSF